MPKEAVIWVTIGVYFAFMLVIGLISSRHTNSMGEFTVGGRNAGAWTSALSYGHRVFLGGDVHQATPAALAGNMACGAFCPASATRCSVPCWPGWCWRGVPGRPPAG